MPIEGADRLTQARPNAVIVYTRSHNQNQNFLAVDAGCFYDLKLKCFVGRAVALFPDGPCVHFWRHISHRRHLAHIIEVFFGRLVVEGRLIAVQSHWGLRKLRPKGRVVLRCGIADVLLQH